MLAKKVVSVDNVTYEFYHLSVRVINKVFIRVLKQVGKSISDGFDEELGENSAEMIKNVLSLLSENLDEDMVDKIIDDILSQTICIGKGKVSDNFDEVFDNVTHLWKVVIEAFKHYFSDFFGEGSILNELKSLEKFHKNVKGNEEKEKNENE
jgi:hypothetical protein